MSEFVDLVRSVNTEGLRDLFVLILVPLYLKIRDICREQDTIVDDVKEIKDGIKRLEGLHLDRNREPDN